MDRIVKSNSGARPHIVTAKKKEQYVCDVDRVPKLEIVADMLSYLCGCRG